ncbi:hypothetical protein FALBO_15111 [Fusarium albosuccineum]|uniref:Uncharacterized protein n=1 Tax=Fusarium albosuccineum TaxID=1237068 RepID=A0A8H4KXB6_9HYPO|nr:hypothetical protein FALBO_15111 [Fusarium albosuccineum]
MDESAALEKRLQAEYGKAEPPPIPPQPPPARPRFKSPLSFQYFKRTDEYRFPHLSREIAQLSRDASPRVNSFSLHDTERADEHRCQNSPVDWSDKAVSPVRVNERRTSLSRNPTKPGQRSFAMAERSQAADNHGHGGDRDERADDTPPLYGRGKQLEVERPDTGASTSGKGKQRLRGQSASPTSPRRPRSVTIEERKDASTSPRQHSPAARTQGHQRQDEPTMAGSDRKRTIISGSNDSGSEVEAEPGLDPFPEVEIPSNAGDFRSSEPKAAVPFNEQQLGIGTPGKSREKNSNILTVDIAACIHEKREESSGELASLIVIELILQCQPQQEKKLNARLKVIFSNGSNNQSDHSPRVLSYAMSQRKVTEGEEARERPEISIPAPKSAITSQPYYNEGGEPSGVWWPLKDYGGGQMNAFIAVVVQRANDEAPFNLETIAELSLLGEGLGMEIVATPSHVSSFDPNDGGVAVDVITDEEGQSLRSLDLGELLRTKSLFSFK